MSLFSNNEVCTGCENAVFCSECNEFRHCRVGAEIDSFEGKCETRIKLKEAKDFIEKVQGERNIRKTADNLIKHLHK